MTKQVATFSWTDLWVQMNVSVKVKAIWGRGRGKGSQCWLSLLARVRDLSWLRWLGAYLLTHSDDISGLGNHISCLKVNCCFSPFFLHIYQVICCLTAVSFFRLVVKTVDYEDEEDAERWGEGRWGRWIWCWRWWWGRPDIIIIIMLQQGLWFLSGRAPEKKLFGKGAEEGCIFKKISKIPKSITIITRLLAMPASFSTRTANVSLSSALAPSSARTCRLARGCGAQLQRERW